MNDEQKELKDPTVKGYVNPPILNNYPYPTTNFSIKGQSEYDMADVLARAQRYLFVSSF